MNSTFITVYIFIHFWIPTLCLVTEMNACFEQIFHCCWHISPLVVHPIFLCFRGFQTFVHQGNLQIWCLFKLNDNQIKVLFNPLDEFFYIFLGVSFLIYVYKSELFLDQNVQVILEQHVNQHHHQVHE